MCSVLKTPLLFLSPTCRIVQPFSQTKPKLFTCSMSHSLKSAAQLLWVWPTTLDLLISCHHPGAHSPLCFPYTTQSVAAPEAVVFVVCFFFFCVFWGSYLHGDLKRHVSLRNSCPRIKLFCANISKGKTVFQIVSAYILQLQTHKCKSFMNGFCLCKLFPRVYWMYPTIMWLNAREVIFKRTWQRL